MVSNPEDSRIGWTFRRMKNRKLWKQHLSHRIRGAIVYLPTFTLNYKPNGGKYTLHGSYWYGFRFSLEHFVQ